MPPTAGADRPEVLIDPDSQTLTEFLRDRVHRGLLVTVLGECTVAYEGRAASQVQHGERLVLLKPDGAFLVHGPRGYRPINWQPSTDAVMVVNEGGVVVLAASRRNPDERVEVRIRRGRLATAAALEDSSQFLLTGSEADLQAALAERPELIEPGLRLEDRELPTRVGGIDLLCRDAGGRLVVVELKRNRASQAAVTQLKRYVDLVSEQAGGEVRGILAAPEISEPARSLLERMGFKYVEVDPMDLLPGEGEQPALFS